MEEIIETSTDDEAFYSCNEGEAMIVYAETEQHQEEPENQEKPKKKKLRKRGPRKPKSTNMDETDDDDVLLCPLANEETPQGDAWEIHMPGKDGEIHFKIDTGADVSYS